jgi:large subunit ribosomal protein L11
MAKLRPNYRDRYVDLNTENETILHIIRLRIKSMSATSGPPIGPVLGQYAIPISKFCSEFNEKSSIYNEGVDVFVTLHHFSDGSFDFEMFTAVTSYCLKRATGIAVGYGSRSTRIRGLITPYLLFEAVAYRLSHIGGPKYLTIRNAVSQGVGTALSIGLLISNST